MRIELTRRAVKDISKLDEATKRRVLIMLKKLEDGKIKINKMQGSPKRWKIRMGHWRIIFLMDFKSETIYIIRVGHRKDIYKTLD